MRRRKRRPWNDGLAPELTTGILCPWLTRTAGRPILRPDYLRTVSRAILDVSLVFVDALTPALRQATAAIEAFTPALKGVFGEQ